MKTVILSTNTASSIDIKTSLVTCTAYTTAGTSSDRLRMRPRLKITSMNGAAATLTVKIRDTTNSITIWQSAYAKDVAADTGMSPALPPVDVVGGTAYAVQVQSTNTSDTAVTWLVEWYDATQVDTYCLNATVQTARDLGASVLLSSGTGTGQVSLSSGTVTVGTNNDKTGYTASTVSDKTGYSLSSSGLDSVSTTAPSGVASNFREMVVQTWRRWFKKSTLDGTSLKTYADDGTTTVTTQAVGNSGATQTQGAAS